MDLRAEGGRRVNVDVPVLLYHSIDADPGPLERPYAVSPAAFAKHAETVATSGRVALTVSELATALRGERELPGRPVAVTFDDGYADNLPAIVALLERGLAATIYVTTGEIGGHNRLTPPQLDELAAFPGVEIGAHSVHHPRLDELPDAALAEEIAASKQRLEALTDHEIRSFSYPYGSYDARVREAVIAAGYESAVAVKNALSHGRDDPFAIARWTVTREVSAERIAGVIEGKGVRRAWSRERLRTRAYRAARRSRRRLSRAVGV
jgi:peptidoglycan/xylan/chitin deacetylase (PgdA/CDA1 family)